MSVHKSLLLSALTLQQDKALAGTDTIANSAWSVVSAAQKVLQHMTQAIMNGSPCLDLLEP